MQKIASILIVLLLLVLAACGNSQSKITQAEAESIVVQDLTENFSKDKDEIKIKSVSKGWRKYIVEWEIDKDCEFGTVQVDDKNGDLLEAMESNC
jgi:ABC-type glycerol-3-phosphate transport system substrate-binding protein